MTSDLRAKLAILNPIEQTKLIREVELEWWHKAHQYCGFCGTKTNLQSNQNFRLCPNCKTEHYPKISPCVIVLVHHENKILLAKHARTKNDIYSCLAGYVDAGETLEECIHRELFEEVGIQVEKPIYHDTQPWPFPSQLMIAFTAKWKSGTPKPDGIEILDAQWFTNDSLPMLPPEISIARRLIRDFFNSTTI